VGIDSGSEGRPAHKRTGRPHVHGSWIGRCHWACSVRRPLQGFWFGDGAVGVEDTRAGLLRGASVWLAVAAGVDQCRFRWRVSQAYATL